MRTFDSTDRPSARGSSALATTRRKRTRDDGATALLGMIASVAIVSLAFTALIEKSAHSSTWLPLDPDAGREALAAQVSGIVMGRGNNWYAGPACVGGLEQPLDGDGIGAAKGRLGLGAEACDPGGSDSGDHRLALSKLRDLNRATAARTANDHADYDEARASLGLDVAGMDLHLRSWPLLASAEQILAGAPQDQHLRPVYIGDYSAAEGGTGVGAPPYTKGIMDQGDRVVVWANLTNDGGSATLFDALFVMELKKGKISFTLHTPVLGAGASGNLSFTLLKTADWEWKSADTRRIEVEVHDKDTKLADFEIDASNITMTHPQTRQNQFAEAEKLSYVRSSGPVEAKYFYASYDGQGDLKEFGDWTYKVYDPSGAGIATSILPTTQDGHVEASLATAGSYVARLWNDALAEVWNQDYINVVDDEPGPYGGAAPSYVPGPSVLPEIRFIDQLVAKFVANAFSLTYSHPTVPYVAGGDVYPDIRDALNNDLASALLDADGQPTTAQYSIVVVGSNVDHNAMTSQAAKGTLKDWVFAGGTLIVFGSDAQNVNWLQPLFHASLESAGGGLLTPDTDHAALHEPNDLGLATYQAASAWEYNAGADSKFTHVVTAGSGGDTLGVANPGSFGQGQVVLSGWRPHDLVADQSATCPHPLEPRSRCEALALTHNLLSLGYRDLHLDYGPPMPSHAAVGTSTRLVSVYHGELEEALALKVLVLVF